MWELEEATIGLFPHIYLSYNELSPEMKRCFSYCAVFPKDSEIDVQQLIRMWMAQGYLRSSGKAEQLESRGYECFSNLAMRSFFQNLERDSYNEAQISSCKMHDIVHDFAQYLTTGECHIIENLDKAKDLSSGKVRHLTWSHHAGDVVTSVVSSVGKLRSFFVVGDREKLSYVYRYAVHRFPIVAPDLFDCLKCVRMLTIKVTELKEVPRAVGELIHLRYIDLSENSSLNELPEEICDLYNLQTLDISMCSYLAHYPQRIGNLVNLRHLLNYGTSISKQISQGLEKLISLRTLSHFNVGNGYDKFEYLKNLHQLGGYLKVAFWKVNWGDLDTTILGDKIHIQGLMLSFPSKSTDYGSVFQLQSLQVPPNLKHLCLFGYPHSNLPSSIVSLNSLRTLQIYHGNVTCLPTLYKLPALEELDFNGLKRIEFLGREFLGITEIPKVQVAFPKLKKLQIYHLENLRKWEDIREEDENVVSVIMPRLQVLEIGGCPKLESLPHRLLQRSGEKVQIVSHNW